VKDILTRSENHPHGIKVRLTDGKIGRVQEIVTHNTARIEAEKTAGNKPPT
jgi:hypothetical protein